MFDVKRSMFDVKRYTFDVKRATLYVYLAMKTAPEERYIFICFTPVGFNGFDDLF